MEKGRNFLLLSTIFCYLILNFYVNTRIRFSVQDKQLFEITKVVITRVDCISVLFSGEEEGGGGEERWERREVGAVGVKGWCVRTSQNCLSLKGLILCVNDRVLFSKVCVKSLQYFVSIEDYMY